jgi:glycosyltransferase involved in cell wall biosynthesis
VKRLLICSPSHAVYGGVENILADLCSELPSRGWTPLLALGKGMRFNKVERYRENFPTLPIIEIDGTKGTRQARLESLEKLLSKTEPDIVLSARIFDALQAVAIRKKRTRTPRLAVTIQAYEAPYLYDARLYAHSLDLCVTSGNMIREALIQWSGIPEERVVSIPGGVKNPNRLIESRSIRLPIRIGYVGRIEQKQKRIFDLAYFLENLNQKRIPYLADIIGTGPEENELKEKLKPSILEGSVRFHSWQSRDNLYEKFYPTFDCLVHFANTEGVTMAPREAMVHGVVPVISEFTGLKIEGQFVHEHNSLTFPIGDIESAGRNIQRLLNEKGLHQRLSENAIKSQKGKYTFQGAIDAWAEAFDRCLYQPPSCGTIPKLNFPSDGRLTRYGLSPWLAQRIRDLLARSYVHEDPGSEWPWHSGLITEGAAREILQFPIQQDRRSSGKFQDENKRSS